MPTRGPPLVRGRRFWCAALPNAPAMDGAFSTDGLRDGKFSASGDRSWRFSTIVHSMAPRYGGIVARWLIHSDGKRYPRTRRRYSSFFATILPETESIS